MPIHICSWLLLEPHKQPPAPNSWCGTTWHELLRRRKRRLMKWQPLASSMSSLGSAYSPWQGVPHHSILLACRACHSPNEEQLKFTIHALIFICIINSKIEFGQKHYWYLGLGAEEEYWSTYVCLSVEKPILRHWGKTFHNPSNIKCLSHSSIWITSKYSSIGFTWKE